MRVFGFIGCVCGDEDRFRFENTKHLLESVSGLDGIFLSGHFGKHGHVSDLLKCDVRDKSLFFLQNCKPVLSRFWQLKLLLDKHKGKLDRQKDWFLCSDDDGIWHPNRANAYRKAIETLAVDPDVTCVAFASVTEFIGDKERRDITCAAQVDLAIEERQIQITPWIYRSDSTDVERDRSVQFYDLCVRADVVLEFFRVTPEHVLRNNYCDVAFCDFVMSYQGTRSVFLENNQWNYYWRRAELSYDMRYATALQFSTAQHRVKDIYELCGNYIQRIAEMSVVPCLEATAQANYENVAKTLQEGERAMLLYEYQRAQKMFGKADAASALQNK